MGAGICAWRRRPISGAIRARADHGRQMGRAWWRSWARRGDPVGRTRRTGRRRTVARRRRCRTTRSTGSGTVFVGFYRDMNAGLETPESGGRHPAPETDGTGDARDPDGRRNQDRPEHRRQTGQSDTSAPNADVCARPPAVRNHANQTGDGIGIGPANGYRCADGEGWDRADARPTGSRDAVGALETLDRARNGWGKFSVVADGENVSCGRRARRPPGARTTRAA